MGHWWYDIYSIYYAAARDSESGLVHRCCPSVRLSVCLAVCRQNAKNAIFSKTKQFRAMVSIDDLYIYRKLCNLAFQRTHYWIPKIQDG